MKCWNCGKCLEDPPYKLPFRSMCDFCDVFLHCCVNCQYYRRGLPNDCKVPNTEFVSDRQRANFCEEFQLLGKKKQAAASVEDVLKKLFNE